MTEKLTPEQINLKRWEELAPLHAQSDYYCVDKFLNDQKFSTLSAIEERELKGIAGKSLLHLQCHIGIDTLSLARKGAIATGVDFSQASITQAQRIASAAKLNTRFILSSLEDILEKTEKNFDIVFSNWGSLCWLSDLNQWAMIIANSLKIGGYVYIADIHPFGLLYSRDVEQKTIGKPVYFRDVQNVPQRFEYLKTYTGQKTLIENTTFYQWPYPLGDVVTALAKNGLHIRFLHEFPYAVYQQMKDMVLLQNGLYAQPHDQIQLPLSFTLMAIKE